MRIHSPTATATIGFGVALVALVPLIVIPDLTSPWVTGKTYYFRAIVAMTAAVWAWLAVKRPSLRPRLTPLLWSWVALLGLVALANLRSLDPQTALWGSFERGDGFITLFWVFTYFLVASVVMRQEVSRRRVLSAWVFSMTTVSIMAIVQYGFALLARHPEFRVSGPLGNPAYLATCLVLSLFMVVGLYAETRRPVTRRLLVAAGWIQLLALVLTSTRGAFVGLAMGLAVAAGLLLRESDDSQVRRSAWQVLALCSAAILFGALVLGPKVLRVLEAPRELSAPIETESAPRGTLARFSSTSGGEQRLRIYGVAAEAILAAPITGHGQGNFDIVADQNWDPLLASWNRLDEPHSVPLRWAFIAGIPGLMAFLAIVGFAGVQVLCASDRTMPLRRAAMIGGVVAYTVNGLFLFDTIASYALVATLLAWIQGTVSPTPKEASARAAGPGRRVLAAAMATSILAAGVWTSVAPARAAWMIGTAERAAIDGRAGVAADLFERVLEGPAAPRRGVLRRARDAAGFAIVAERRLAIRRGLRPEQPQSWAGQPGGDGPAPLLTLAIEETYRQIDERPDNGRIRYDLAGLLIAAGGYEKERSQPGTGRFEEARLQLLAARPLMPEYQAITVRLAVVALETGDAELAYQLAVTAAESFPKPLTILAETAVATRRIDEARSILESIYRGLPPDLRESKVEEFLARASRQWVVADGP